FAAHADPRARLLFKSHPADNGVEAHGRHIAAAGDRCGIGERVLFADEGHFPSLIKRCCAVITVNSTGGLSAIESGRPTIVLGNALYDIPGLTHQGGLHGFWRAAELPDQDLFERFRALVMAETQINGAFSTDHGMALSVDEAA